MIQFPQCSSGGGDVSELLRQYLNPGGFKPGPLLFLTDEVKLVGAVISNNVHCVLLHIKNVEDVTEFANICSFFLLYHI